MSTNINIVVRDKDTPVPDTGVITPDTGRYTNTNSNSTSMEGGMIAFTIILSSLLLLSIALIFFSRLFRKKAINTTTNSTTNKANLYSSNNKTNSITTNSITNKANLFRTLGLLLFIFTATTGIVANILKNTSFPTYATDTPLDITTSDTTITVVREDGPAFAVASAEITLNEATPAGYNLYVYGPDGNKFTSNTTTATIDTVVEKNSIISNNTYGVANTTNEPLITDAVWNPVGDTEDNAELIATTTNATNVGDKITIYYGILVDEALPAGIYTGSIEYKAYTRTYTITYDANGGTINNEETKTEYIERGSNITTLPTPEREGYTFKGWFAEGSEQQVTTGTIPTEDITYYAHWQKQILAIQDTAAVIDAIDNSPDGTVIATDIRDDKEYLVGRLADGRIWMLDNLALDLTAQDASTNITVANTNASATSLDYLFGTTQYDPSDDPDGRYAQAAVSATWEEGDDSYTEPRINTAYSNKTVKEAYEEDENHSGETYEGIDATWKIGNYYNFCAASAGSYCYGESFSSEGTNATEDICPAGWRMPTGGDSGEYYTLYNAYSGESDQETAFRTALQAPLAGYVYSGSVGNQGRESHFWSSTGSYDYYVYTLDVYEYDARPGNDLSRYIGTSVRCIMKQSRPAQSNIPLQNTSAIAAAVPNVGDIVNAVDSRDGTEYLVGKLADGRIWLLDNLALDLTAVNASTNITAANTNASATSLTALFNGNGTNNLARSAVSTDWEDSFNSPFINTKYIDEPRDEMEDWPIGVYYNYCAASAGSYCYDAGYSIGDTAEDICPAGWRMSTGGSDYAINEYSILYNTYYQEDQQEAVFRTALRASLPGYIESGGIADEGLYGAFWSSTRYDENNMNGISMGTDYVYPEFSDSRHYGNLVRCIMKQPRPAQSNIPLQNTTAIANALSNVGDIINAVDSRDGTEYLVGKLADGRIWLLDNLALDLTATNASTNITAANTNASTASLGHLFGTTQYDPSDDPEGRYAQTAVSTNWISDSFADPLINTDYINEFKNEMTDWPTGVYYNFCAASAGSYCYDGSSDGADATEDICPAGWRIPNGDYDNNEFNTLYGLYHQENQWDLHQPAAFRMALLAPFSGYFMDGLVYDQGVSGAFYSSTMYNSYDTFELCMDAEEVFVSRDECFDARHYGISVRCIMKEE